MIMDRSAESRRWVSMPLLAVLLAWSGFVLAGSVTAQEETTVTQTEDGRTVVIKRVASEDGATLDVTVEVTAGGDGEVAVGELADGVHHILLGHLFARVKTLEDYAARISPAALATFLEAHPTADADADGDLSRQEHDAFLVALAMSDPASVLEAYPAVDTNGNDTLEESEAAMLVRGGCDGNLPASCAKWISSGDDEDEDGAVRFGSEDGNVFVTRTVQVRTFVRRDDSDEDLELTFPAGTNPVQPAATWLVENIDLTPSQREVAGYLDAVSQGGSRQGPSILLERFPEIDVDEDGEVSMEELHEFKLTLKASAATDGRMIFMMEVHETHDGEDLEE